MKPFPWHLYQQNSSIRYCDQTLSNKLSAEEIINNLLFFLGTRSKLNKRIIRKHLRSFMFFSLDVVN